MTAELLLACGLAASAVRAEAAPPRISDSLIQIGIVPRAGSVSLRARGAFSVVDQKTGETHDLRDQETYRIEAKPGTLHFGSFLFLGQVRLLPKSPSDFVELGQNRYHGSLLVRPNPDSTLTVIQETGIEEYLYGVLAKEMSADWPAEALKAQAVVSRTFTLSNLGKFGSAGFDLSTDQQSQVYGGLDGHDPRATAAVQATEGEVLHFKGKVLKAFFHSCCGGATANAGEVWGDARLAGKPLGGARDRWCDASPHMAWKATFAFDDILRALNRNGHLAAVLKGVGRGKSALSGHLRTLKFYTNSGTIEVRADHFRKWMGSTDLKSTKITRITRRRKGYEFVGRGFGHGAGLCQWGARSMAEDGKGYRDILSHYFPGAELVRRDD